MKFLKLALPLALALAVPSVAQADLWTEANAAFARRENNPAKIAEARTKYLQLANQTTGADRIKAVSQLGRLAIYEGEMLLAKTDTAGRTRVFGDCWCKSANVLTGRCSEPGFVELIAPSVVGENPAYYYFKGMCLAYWGQVASTAAQLRFVGQLQTVIEGGSRQDGRFEGGGIDRLAGGVYANAAARPLGLYRPAEAIERSRAATRRAAYPGDPNSGAFYFENWRVLAEALEANGQNAEALAVVNEKITELMDLIDADELPRGRAPETKWTLARLREVKARLQGN